MSTNYHTNHNYRPENSYKRALITISIMTGDGPQRISGRWGIQKGTLLSLLSQFAFPTL